MPMGGGESGGAVVGGPTPAAALMAGYYNSSAASQAAEAARTQTNDAINFIRSNYSQAFQSLKPYTSEGIAALDQLNSYMGLGAYNPGTAPKAPEAPTLASLAGKVSQADIQQYINSNIGFGPVAKGSGRIYYNGVRPEGESKAWSAWVEDPRAYNAGGYLGKNGAYADAIRAQLAQDRLGQATEGYNSEMDVYNQQMDLYNQAQQLAANHQDYTPEQAQAKLMAQPGVGFAYNQGLDAIQRAAASKGQLNSGRLLQSLSDYGQGMASQQYGETLSRLSSLVGAGQQAAGQNANASMNLGNIGGQMKTNLGDTLANSYLASGNALSQALLSANQQYKVVGQQSSGGGLGGIGSVLGGLGSLMGGGGGLGGLFG